MLEETKIQLQEILDNCSDQKLKPIIERAIPKWISGEIKPAQKSYGIYCQDENYIPLYNDRDCCLIGTALIGMKGKGTPSEDAVEIFNLSDENLSSYISSFDGNVNFNGTVSQIRKILFGA